MKSRSHRLPISDPPDDWVDGSWTVDCVCGVNFDDGEEMVNCDECGVWVHTRCSRYVKREKVFACDKCKSKKSNRNDSEETEVAQLLVELPTKTLKMEKPYSVGGGPNWNPFQIWTDIPMEEKVHVQGIPGGDPALFDGLSSVFSPELWKCTGYVPKKFNFQYREFPGWDDEKKEDGKKGEEEIETPASNGAGVLFSLSKENVLPSPVAALGGMKKQAGGGACDKLAQTTDRKKRDVEKSEVKRAHNDLKKERSSLKPIVVHSNKRKKEDFRTSKDNSVKKKARGVDKDRDSNKRGAHFSESVHPNPSDAKQLEFNEGKDPKVVKTDKQSCKDGNLRSDLVANPLSDGCPKVENSVGNSSNKLISSQRPSETLALDVSGCNPSIEARLIEENVGHHIPLSVEIPPRADDGAASSLDHNDMETNPLKDKVTNDAIPNVIDNGRDPVTAEGAEPVGEDLATAAPVIRDNQICQDSIGEVLSSSLQPIEVKAEAKTDSPVETSNAKTSPSSDVMLDSSKPSAQLSSSSVDLSHAAVEVNGASVVAMVPRDQKVQIVCKSRLTVDCQADKADELPSDHCQPKGHSPSLEGSLIGQKSSSEFKHGPSKLNGSVVSPSGIPNQRKVLVSVGKISSSSSAVVIPKPSVSDTSRPANIGKHDSNIKQKGTSENNLNRKKDKTSTDALREADGRERQRIIAKEPPKSSVTSAPKTSNLSKFAHAPVSKKTFSSSRDHVIQSSSRTSSVQKAAGTPDSGESASSLQAENSLVQNKNTASSFSLRGEKINQANCQPASKNNMQSLHPPTPSNPPANLSDEELALLLHQELNSSPRVPRVPRMRHAGSLPQLATPTATSMLMKRTSSSGGKDGLTRRRNKDLIKDGPAGSRELEDGAKTGKVSSYPDQKKHDPAENVSPKVIHSADKSIPPVSTTISSGPSSSNEANEQILSSTRNSPRNASDDDIGNVGILIPRTLPGLIAEIMSKGQRMTYEELCNAVLPHWPNLRKHNGERYAYSSHSQAVLDCLRNRSEWSRLVDRGPKTNAGRKRRKHEVDPQNLEAEDNDYSKDRDTKDIDSKVFESQLNEVPRGKRKARKRSLALQGRRIKDVRRSYKAEVCSDDTESSSNSSEERIFSDEETQGDETCPRVSEASASSEEMETMS